MAQALYFHNATLVLPDRLVENGALVCREGKIAALGSAAELPQPAGAQAVDADGGFLAPGYVDLHVHGAQGNDYMDGSVDAVQNANRGHARHGTTSIFPTTTTGTPAQVKAMLDACAQARAKWTSADGARIAGVHLYGPYFASEKIGAHPKGYNRHPDPAEYEAYFEMNLVRVATCAAELPGAEAFYRAATARGCLATCGHSNASFGEMARGFRAGLRHVDHFWSAMSTVTNMRERLGTPMQGSMEQFVLREEGMSTEVIADGFHLGPELLEFAFHFKGVKRLCLVTDSSRALDMPAGDYHIGPRSLNTVFQHDGQVGRMGAGLASSAQGLDFMVRHMHKTAGISLPDAVRMASLTPAERTGLDSEIGSLAVGKRADLVLLGKDLLAQRVFLGGELFPA